MDKKIGIILTSIERPQSLKKSVESILTVWQDEWALFIGLQDDYESESFSVIEKIIEDNPDKEIRLYDLEYDCGISVARNELIQKVSLWGIPYTLLTADSITFQDMACLYELIEYMRLNNIDLVGLELLNRIPWEAKLNLIPNQSFELDFIDYKEKEKYVSISCDIVRNFWIARTAALIKVPYDEQLIMCEHEDFFWRAKIHGFVCGCTNTCAGIYNKEENTPEYDKIRTKNFRIGQQRLKDKYSLKGWVTYKHFERTQL